jgi:hypothetical protein
MTYQVIVRPEAAREIQEAFDWYEGQSEGLGLDSSARPTHVCRASVETPPPSSPFTSRRAARYSANFLTRCSTFFVMTQSSSSHVFT